MKWLKKGDEVEQVTYADLHVTNYPMLIKQKIILVDTVQSPFCRSFNLFGT